MSATTSKKTKDQNDNIQHSFTKYNVQRWQTILSRMKMNPSEAAVRSSNKKFECNRCKSKFVHLCGLERHKAKFHADDVGVAPPKKVQYFAATIKCACCGALFPNVDQYARHSMGYLRELLQNSIQGIGDDLVNNILCSQRWTIAIGSAFMCEFCDTRFSDLPSLFLHETLHDPADGFCCVFCQLHLGTLEGILAHRVNKPEVCKRECDGEIPNVANVYCCNVCKNFFETLQELNNHRHEMNHFFPRKTQKQLQMRGLIENCRICGYLSNSASQLAAHYNEKHAKTGNAINETAESGSSRQMPVFNQEESVKISRPYLCEKCGKTYTQSSHLWQHLRFHNGVRPFVCPRHPCNRRFTIRPDLNDHIRKCHTGERPYKCEVCDKRFLTGSVYYQHRLIHRGERRYACPDCDKRFYRTDALKNHQRIHTGEKPYSCEFCKRKFRQRGDREKHIRVKHMKIR